MQAAEYQTATGPALAAFKFIMACDAMATMATALSKSISIIATDAAAVGNVANAYRTLATSNRAIWHAQYWNVTHGMYGYVSENGRTIQALSAAALTLGGLPAGRGDIVVQQLQADMIHHDHHFTVGEVGVAPLLATLSGNTANMFDTAFSTDIYTRCYH
jgi:hypothetical protein